MQRVFCFDGHDVVGNCTRTHLDGTFSIASDLSTLVVVTFSIMIGLHKFLCPGSSPPRRRSCCERRRLVNAAGSQTQRQRRGMQPGTARSARMQRASRPEPSAVSVALRRNGKALRHTRQYRCGLQPRVRMAHRIAATCCQVWRACWRTLRSRSSDAPQRRGAEWGGQRREVESTPRPHHRRRQHRHVLSRRVLQFGAARRVEVRNRSTRRTRARAALGAVRPRAPGAAASRGGAEHMSQELRLGRSLSARAAASRARARSAQSCGQRKLR